MYLGRKFLECDRSTRNKNEIRQVGSEQVKKLSRAQEAGLERSPLGLGKPPI